MDARSHESARPTFHGVVTPPPRRRNRTVLVTRAIFVAMAAVMLVAGIAGGLARVGVVAPAVAGTQWLGYAALNHAALMICGFLCTVIAIERAVAVKSRMVFLAPMLSGTSGLCLLFGWAEVGAWLNVAASMCFVGVNVVIVLRQRAAHTALLLVGALSWFIGSLAFAITPDVTTALPWWFAFLVLTVAAERLEMARLMRQTAATRLALHGVLAILLLGALVSARVPDLGAMLYGLSLMLLAAWLACFDIARRTVRTSGLSRYMAVCLLGAYAWLVVAGAAWAAAGLGLPTRDAALHALALGFLFSMIMGHAPVILPAIAGVRLRFGRAYYVPLALLHGSLLLRLGAGMFVAPLRALGASFNAIAIAMFTLTMTGAAIAWRRNDRRRASGPSGRQ
ncbi:hypothetical protein [Ralstonia solanacearum]|uniref:hypothetical protein n=1 Tax=Ralstonia solanacearum TaxID=305 RepID=UPI001FEE121C|nr:hypothetical protein [Ralstonia solanacearum]